MDAHWAFLAPWLEALQPVLVRAGEKLPHQDEQRFVCATFSCWPSLWNVDAVVAECTLDVALPADQASRQDVDRLHRIREAVMIFDTLAAVDNAAFVAALSEYMRLHHVKEGPPRAVWPEWRFSLGGLLSADDAVTKAPYVTWGELLLGSPDDTWQHSPGCCDVMKKLQEEGIGPMGSHRNSKTSIKWEIEIEGMNIMGDQQLNPTKRKRSPLSDGLGKLLMLEAPPVFVIESVSDSIALLKSWQTAPITRLVDIIAEVGTTCVSIAKYEALGIGEVAAALAHAKMPSFQLRLQDFVADDGKVGRGMANAGFIFSLLCSGRTLCSLSGVTDFPALERHKAIRSLNVICERANDLWFSGVLSAVAEGKMVGRLLVQTDPDEGTYRDPLHWKWLAYALWGRTSNACIPKFGVGLISLTEEHVIAIMAVLRCSYPQPVEHSTSSNSQYGFANIQAGTELRSVGLSAEDDTVLVVSRDLRCRAHYKSSDTGNQLDVVVPGYGICTMPNVDVFESDDVVGSPSGFLGTAATPCRVRSLTISFSDIENDALLPRFLALIGGRLRSLSLYSSFMRLRSVGFGLCSVAAACPELQTLRVSDFQVSISDDDDALRSWNLKKLHIGGSDVNGLIRMLEDPTYRTSRELVELRLDRLSSSQPGQFRFTVDDLNALKAHDGEFLPVVKEKFPLRAKLSFISVVNCRRAGRFLDSSMLSIVFAFAAIPEQRRVLISCERTWSGQPLR